jgi:hypothetical protein
MAFGYYATLDEADDYFNSERLEIDAWDKLEDKKKQAALIQAFNRLYYGKEYSVPAYADASASQLEYLTRANAEMAYYLILHLKGEDARKNLQAQGVERAEVVGEWYSEDDLMKVPIPAIVDSILSAAGLVNTARIFTAVNLTRDEDESV